MKHGKTKFGALFRILMLACLLQSVMAQGANLTVEMHNKTVKEVIRQIETVSEYVFFYSGKDVDKNRRVTVKAIDLPVEKVLEQLFAGTDNSYRIDGRQIFITRNSTKTLQAPQQRPDRAQPARKTVTGVVSDETGEPLAGAAVIVKGSPRGVTADSDGTFSIEVSPDDILEMSYIGYETLQVKVGNQTYISVKLEPKRNELDEVTVVAF
ncbi:MAG: carboxypeptidase-like regulatory domain-containing protein, partial [Tannerella sp.]|nr:carboxypeptidase-like regulatory domain-containing protein [Tannerella sp.]